jgi:hypothetical protein
MATSPCVYAPSLQEKILEIHPASVFPLTRLAFEFLATTGMAAPFFIHIKYA